MTNEGYIRLTDIWDVKEAELIEICPGMKKGMAKRILTMAKQDIRSLTRKRTRIT